MVAMETKFGLSLNTVKAPLTKLYNPRDKKQDFSNDVSKEDAL